MATNAEIITEIKKSSKVFLWVGGDIRFIEITKIKAVEGFMNQWVGDAAYIVEDQGFVYIYER
jgi:hypothetical protein